MTKNFKQPSSDIERYLYVFVNSEYYHDIESFIIDKLSTKEFNNVMEKLEAKQLGLIEGGTNIAFYFDNSILTFEDSQISNIGLKNSALYSMTSFKHTIEPKHRRRCTML